MAQGSSKKFCSWCGEPLKGPASFCSACGADIEEQTDKDFLESNGNDSSHSPLAGVIVLAVIVSVSVYFILNWLEDDTQADTFVPTESAPCHGWIDWSSRAPEVSQLFDAHWALTDGTELTRDEYRAWLDLERDIKEQLEDAGAVPYILTDYKKHTLAWLEAMDWILVEYVNGGDDVTQMDFAMLHYNSDQMGIEWSNAILECPPSARS